MDLTQLRVQTNALFFVLRERNITGSPTANQHNTTKPYWFVREFEMSRPWVISKVTNKAMESGEAPKKAVVGKLFLGFLKTGDETTNRAKKSNEKILEWVQTQVTI
jgi:hypothetical protein